MDFEYDPYSALDDFCSNSFNNKLEQAAKPQNSSGELNPTFEAIDLSLENDDIDNKLEESKFETGSSQIEKTEDENLQSNKSAKKKGSRKNRSRKKGEKGSSDESAETIEDIPEEGYSRRQLGRARRNYMASLPAEESVDLIDEYPPDSLASRVTRATRSAQRQRRQNTNNRRLRSNRQNLVVIGSDSEDEQSSTAIKFGANSAAVGKMHDEDDEDNPEIQILIEWRQKIEKHKIRKYQNFLDIFQLFADRENVSIKDILFNFKKHIISETDTPDKINYKFGDIINGRVVQNCQSNISQLNTKKDSNEISLKIQSNLWKKPIEISIKKTDSLKVLYIKCAEALELNMTQFVLKFDGDNLQTNETPEDLDFEGGEIIDLVMLKKRGKV